MEIKFSTLWSSGTYRFQQIRDQNYDILICLGISPQTAHCWAIPKEVIMQKWKEGSIPSQHGGVRGRDTAWLHVNPLRVPEWLQPYGGTLEEGLSSLRRLVKHSWFRV